MKLNSKIFPAIVVSVLMLLHFSISVRAESALMELPMEQLLRTASLDDLLDVVVYSVSKTEQLSIKSPGIVTVITSDKIKALGAQTVAEAISRLVGVFKFDSYFTQYDEFAIRNNISGGPFNSKILFLVNGHPNYHAVTGGFAVNSIPLDLVDRIEIVRGPMPIVYGTNALSGMINIVTKRDLGNSTATAYFGAGSFGSTDTRITASQTIGEDFTYIVSGAIQDQDGYKFTYDPNQDEAGRGGSHALYKHENTAFVGLTWKNLQLDFSRWEEKKPAKIGVIPNSFFSIPYFEQTYTYMDVRYAFIFSPRAKLRLIGRLDDMTTDYRIENYSLIENATLGTKLPAVPILPRVYGRKIGTEVLLNLTPTDDLSSVFGLAWDRIFDGRYDGDLLFPDGTKVPSGAVPWTGVRGDRYHGAFYNTQYSITDWLSVVGGVRYSYNGLAGDHFDYMVGVINFINKDLAIKALYGTSYRSPSLFEWHTEALPNIVGGNTNLKAESLGGFDLSLRYSGIANTRTVLTYYHQKISDIIGGTLNVSDGGVTYNNLGEEEIRGIELETEYELIDSLLVFVNASHVLDTDIESLYVINNNVSFGATFDLLPNRLSLTQTNLYTGKWGKAGDNIISDILLRYKYKWKGHSFELIGSVKNVFDRETEYSEITDRTIDTIPGSVPLTVMIGLRDTF